MAVRWVVSRVDQYPRRYNLPPDVNLGRRAKAALFASSHDALLGEVPGSSLLSHPWALVRINGWIDDGALNGEVSARNDGEITFLPDLTRDQLMGENAVTTPAALAVRHGIQITSSVSESFRDFINKLGRILSSGFEFDTFGGP